MIRAVLFDFGNVLIHYSPEPIVREIRKRSGKPIGTVAEFEAGHGKALTGFEMGTISGSGMACIMNEAAGLDLPEEEWSRIYNLGNGEPIAGMEELVRSLKGRVFLGVLSNTNPWHWQYDLRTYPVLREFDRIFVSYEIGHMKPDPRIYRHVLGRIGFAPEETVFIDDRPENAEGASRVGMHGIRFTGTEDLRTSLEKLRTAGHRSE